MQDPVGARGLLGTLERTTMAVAKQIAVLVAVLCVSSVVGAILLSLALALYFSVMYLDTQTGWSDILAFAALLSLVAVPVALLFGVPAFFAFRRFGVLRWWSLTALGASLGTAMGGTWVAHGVPWLGCVALGLVSAYIAWLLLVRSNLPLNSDAPASGAPIS